jgi:CheY-like chemotaxis protein
MERTIFQEMTSASFTGALLGSDEPVSLSSAREECAMTKIVERPNNAKILIIDDSRGDLILTRLAFKRSELALDIVTAGTAEEGLRILRHEDDLKGQRLPDLILCDLNLPQANGLWFLRIVKADPVVRRIPVLILTSSSLEKDIDACYDGFASGYLTKPYTNEGYDQLVDLVERYWFVLVHSPGLGYKPGELSRGDQRHGQSRRTV